MAKQIILVTGNIASGKSTLCKQLAADCPGYTHMAMDAYRMKYGDWTVEGDNRAKSAFKSDIRKRDRVFYETIGRGSVYQYVMQHFAASMVMRIQVVTPLETCIQRHSARASTIPYPFQQSDTINQMAEIDRFLSSQPANFFYHGKAEEYTEICRSVRAR